MAYCRFSTFHPVNFSTYSTFSTTFLYLPSMKNIWYNILLLFLPVMSYAQTDYYLLIGTYTKGKSEGIYVYKMNSETGDVSLVSKAAASNPSYLALSPD